MTRNSGPAMSETDVTILTDKAIAALAAEVAGQAREAFAQGRRYILGIAGIPGSGKSTFAQQLAAAVERTAPGITRVIPMDGFHLSNQRLDELGLRSLKGSPATFDVAAFIALLASVKEPPKPDGEARRAVGVSSPQVIPFPIYDRALHEPVLSRDSSHAITPSTQLIITEGNYLLLDELPWSQLTGVLDACWWLDTPLDQARQWILSRHIRGGREIDSAVQHYGRTDLPNAKLVLSKMRKPDRGLKRAPR
ncbi:MAG: hypothetical protein WD768_14215 [Phycisphaeraceae bacterium]